MVTWGIGAQQIIPVTETGIVRRPPLSAGSDAALKRRSKIYLEPIFSHTTSVTNINFLTCALFARISATIKMTEVEMANTPTVGADSKPERL